MSEFQSSNFIKENGGTPDLLGKTELTSPYFFVPPSGNTASRPQSCAPGTLRFNTDIGSLEVFRGDTIGWEQIQRREGQYLGGGTGSNTGLGTRAVAAGGNSVPDSTSESISYVTISTLGNSQDFGDLLTGINANTAGSSRTRGLSVAGSFIPARTNTIEFFTFSSLGNSQNFGDLTSARTNLGSASSPTRGLFLAGGTPGNVNTIDFVEIATTGNAQDFGDMDTDGATNGVIRPTGTSSNGHGGL